MLRFTLRSLLARKIRLVLSAVAIALGTAFLSGSLVFTDTLARSFDDIVAGSIADASVRLTGSEAASMDAVISFDQRTLPASLATKLADAPGVARADGTVFGQGLFVIKPNGKLLGGTGAPTMAFNYSDAPNASGEPIARISEGRAPVRAGEVAIDERSVDTAGFKLGDTVDMVTAGEQPRLSATLVGVIDFAGGGLAGATLVYFDTKTAQAIFQGGQDTYTSIDMTADDGVSQDEIVQTVRPLLPADAEAVTGQEMADEVESVIDIVLGYLNTFLLVFAAIALVVGSLLIINTFSILVAQRSRELAVLRALGASRSQITRSVLAEAFAVGVFGATAGLLLGFGLAAGLRAVFASFGLDLSETALVFAPSTIVLTYLVGVTVTMLAAYLPARRAARVAPVQAMQVQVSMPGASQRRRLIVGAVLGAAGGVLMVLGLSTDIRWAAAWAGLGMFGVLIGVIVLAPVIAVPMLVPLRAVYRRLFGSTGRLAADNAIRNPGRTAATASALMIGLALVTTISIVASSVSRSIDRGVDEQFTSDFLISNAIGQSFSPTIARDVAAVDDVAVTASAQTMSVDIDDESATIDATDARALGEIFDIDFISGGAPLGDGQIALTEDKASSLGVSVGDTVTLGFASGDLRATVRGVYESTYVVTDAMVPFSTVDAAQIQRADTFVAVNAVDGVELASLGRELDEVTKDFPTVTVQNKDDFADSQRAQVNQLLYLIYALLGLAIVIASLGIVNTLALSVIERTREVGLLRAVGLDRRQLRQMVRLEAIAISLLGAALGIATGLLFGVALRELVSGQGVTDLAIPWVRLVEFIVIAAAVGVLAAVVPARRAARMNVLDAIAHP